MKIFFLLIALVLFFSSAPPLFAADRCAEILRLNYIPDVTIELTGEKMFVNYPDDGRNNRQYITGDKDFSPEGIAISLAVDLASIPTADPNRQLRPGQTDFLLVAMSVTSLLPMLMQKGYDARALDIWYNQPNIPAGPYASTMRTFNQIFKKQLIGASALNMPVEDESVAHLWSYRLVSAQSSSFQNRFLDEAARVVAVGGQIRIHGYTESEAAAAASYIQLKYGAHFTSKVQRKPMTWVYAQVDNAIPFLAVPVSMRSYVNDFLLVVAKKFSLSQLLQNGAIKPFVVSSNVVENAVERVWTNGSYSRLVPFLQNSSFRPNEFGSGQARPALLSPSESGSRK